MNTLAEWAQAWGVPPAALEDLRNRMISLDYYAPPAVPGLSEAAVQAAARVRASKIGMRVWRNNVGAFHDPESGTFMRFGLANDSAQVNARIKSGDLVGVRPVLIGPEHVGQRIGQFVSFECKHSGWRWTGTEREHAQMNWANLVQAFGGEARFITSAEQI